MDWSRAVNHYCERTDASLWSEPVNALSNLAFLVAAALCWRRLGARRDPGARLLILVLASIGLGSFLFHTYARVWAALADVLPILAFILIYLHLATTRFLRAPVWAGLLAATAYIPVSMALSAGLTAVFGPLDGSISYVPVALVIGAYAVALRGRDPETGRGLAIGAGLLCLSLGFRTIDQAICPIFPLGTHFLWHLLNGTLLGWMILVLIRQAERRD